MNVALWVLQGCWRWCFAHGVMMLAPPAEVTVPMNAMLPRSFQVFLGVAESCRHRLDPAGADTIQPGLVPAAAAGIVIVIVSATGTDLRAASSARRRRRVLLLVMAIVVAYGRSRRLPIRHDELCGRRRLYELTSRRRSRSPARRSCG